MAQLRHGTKQCPILPFKPERYSCLLSEHVGGERVNSGYYTVSCSHPAPVASGIFSTREMNGGLERRPVTSSSAQPVVSALHWAAPSSAALSSSPGVPSACRPGITPRPSLMNFSRASGIFSGRGYVTITCHVISAWRGEERRRGLTEGGRPLKSRLCWGP